jgi:prepilin-type N-terminal cleavage/methylation domain-containing protein
MFQASRSRGFTLIEMLISSGLFTIIILIGIGAVLTVTSVHKKNQKLRSVVDTISFAMEDIARNARLGSAYNCGTTGGDCSDLTYQFSFEQVDGDWDLVTGIGDEFVYRMAQSQNGDYFTLEKSEFGLASSDNDFYQLLPREVEIDMSKSGFKVSGSPLGDGLQPYVRIRLAGVIDYRGVRTPFALETIISQRQVDQ